MFGKRFNIFRIGGINIGIDFSWFFLAILLTWTLAAGYFPSYYPNLTQQNYWLMGFLGMIGLVASIVLHELGHALTAKRYHVPISQITLFIFGGVAELKKESPTPKIEFLIAIAGPIVSVILSILFFTVAELAIFYGLPKQLIAVVSYLAVVNFIVVIFNLVPAFPLDGGRVLRAFLWWWKNNLGWATTVTSRLGSGFGFGLIFLGLFSFITGNFLAGMWWMILGLFLQQAATFSRTQYYIQKELRGASVGKLMKTDIISVPPDISVDQFIKEYVYVSFHRLYPVVREGELLGYVSLNTIKEINQEDWQNTKIDRVLVPLSKTPTVTPKTTALKALQLFHESETETLFVAEGKHLVGLLTAHDLFKIVSFKMELEEKTSL